MASLGNFIQVVSQSTTYTFVVGISTNHYACSCNILKDNDIGKVVSACRMEQQSILYCT